MVDIWKPIESENEQPIIKATDMWFLGVAKEEFGPFNTLMDAIKASKKHGKVASKILKRKEDLTILKSYEPVF